MLRDSVGDSEGQLHVEEYRSAFSTYISCIMSDCQEHVDKDRSRIAEILQCAG